MSLPSSNSRLPLSAAVVVALLAALALAFGMPGCLGRP